MPAQPEIFIEKAKDSLKDLIISADVKAKNQVELIVKKENILEVANHLKLEMGFTYPSAAGGMDYLDDNRMQMIYYIQNPDTGLPPCHRRTQENWYSCGDYFYYLDYPGNRNTLSAGGRYGLCSSKSQFNQTH